MLVKTFDSLPGCKCCFLLAHYPLLIIPASIVVTVVISYNGFRWFSGYLVYAMYAINFMSQTVQISTVSLNLWNKIIYMQFGVHGSFTLPDACIIQSNIFTIWVPRMFHNTRARGMLKVLVIRFSIHGQIMPAVCNKLLFLPICFVSIFTYTDFNCYRIEWVLMVFY